MEKSKCLRELITNTQKISLFLEAHNGISAKIVERAKADAIWASGFTMSTSMGVRDANELSWTQVVSIVESMCDCTSIPILVDGDTGYGNFNNARIFVKKLSSLGVAGIVFEDKLFPKINSFTDTAHPLEDVELFCNKIKACKDYQANDDFCLIARTESLIAGLGMDMALDRAFAYAEAGADAIVIHSKKNTPEEILEFCGKWGQQVPLITIPTKYEAHPISQFEGTGITGMIFANHLMRASIKIMDEICRSIVRQPRSTGFNISSVDEIFQLTDMPSLIEDEKIWASCHDFSNLYTISA